MEGNTSISLGDHFENFVDKGVSTGRFRNASEVIRAGLRLFEEEETKILAVQKAIEDGIESGIVRNFNSKKHLEKLKSDLALILKSNSALSLCLIIALSYSPLTMSTSSSSTSLRIGC